MAALSGDLASWLSRQAIDLFGSATFVAVNLLIAFFGLFYLLLAGDTPWRRVARYLPFSEETTERLRARFHDVTRATILGIGATALLQGSIVGLSFHFLGLGHPLLWGAVTGIVSVLPILGSSMVWLPGTVVLLVDHSPGAAAILAAIGFIVASNVDNFVRPIIFRRVSHVHPLVTVVGAFAGMRYFGLLGVLLGPLALVYFIELVLAYEQEYGGVGGPPSLFRGQPGRSLPPAGTVPSPTR
jgi:predicted PurR-regulated permease PerM